MWKPSIFLLKEPRQIRYLKLHGLSSAAQPRGSCFSVVMFSFQVHKRVLGQDGRMVHPALYVNSEGVTAICTAVTLF